MNSDENLLPIGAWTNDDLRATASMGGGIGADSDLPNDVRFLSGITKLVRRRLAHQTANQDPCRPAVFLLQPQVPPHKPNIISTREPRLTSGLTTVTGRLWFTPAPANSGRYIDFDDCTDDVLFRMVTDEYKCGDVPTVIFDPRTKNPTIWYYPEGIDNLDTYEIIEINNTDISIERIFAEIDKVYEKFVTPDIQLPAGRLWKEHDKWYPVGNAEGLIQLYLAISLSRSFPTCTIRYEQPQTAGRSDIEIEEYNPHANGQVIRHAILELKVLRSFSETGKRTYSEAEILDQISDGLEQAAAYAIHKSCRMSALCCFDMRKEDTNEKCFAHIVERARELKVAMKRWYVYATAKQYRHVLTNPVAS